MADVHCLTPDCGFIATGELEAAKREAIAHGNLEHAETTIMIACAHEVADDAWEQVEREVKTQRGKRIERERVGVCVRCGNRIVESVQPLVSEDEVTAAAEASA